MKLQKTAPLLLIAAVSAGGCALPKMPETAQGMRQVWNEHRGEKWYPQVNTEVPLPFDKAVQLVKAKAHECLDVTLTVTSRGDYGGTYTWQKSFTPTMTVNGKKAELFLVLNTPGNFGSTDHVLQITADFTPASAHSTKVVVYHLSYNPSERIANAVAAWAGGKNVGCPDMER